MRRGQGKSHLEEMGIAELCLYPKTEPDSIGQTELVVCVEQNGSCALELFPLSAGSGRCWLFHADPG